jgi:hypothetical protein
LRAGLEDELHEALPDPHRFVVTGHWREAASTWAELGHPYRPRLRSQTATPTPSAGLLPI